MRNQVQNFHFDEVIIHNFRKQNKHEHLANSLNYFSLYTRT